MQKLRLFVVLFLMGAIPSMASAQQLTFPSAALVDPNAAPASAPADTTPGIGPWFVAALPELAPAQEKIERIAKEAVEACPAKAVVCSPYASGGLEQSPWNPIFAGRRLTACVNAVIKAGGSPTSGGVYSTGVEGERGRGVLLSCATVTTKAAFSAMAESDRPVLRSELSPGAQQELAGGDKVTSLSNPSYLFLDLGGFGSVNSGDSAELAGGFMGLGWSKGRFLARGKVGLGYSELGVGGIAALMAGARVTNWFDITLGPVGSASFADQFSWTAQYGWGFGLGLGFTASIFHLELIPTLENVVDRYKDDPRTSEHVGATWRPGVTFQVGLEFWN